MKKYLKIIVTLVLMLILLTGCANVNYEVQINDDGSGDISYIIGLNIEELENLGINPKEVYDSDIMKFKDKAEENGYTVEDYKDNTTLGFKATKHCDDITTEDLFGNLFNDMPEVKFNENTKIQKEKGTFKDKYSQQAVVDLTAINKDEDSLLNRLNIIYKVSLPGKARNNNATNVLEGGRILEWKLKPGEINEINFASKNSNAYLMIGLGVFGLIISSVVTSRVVKKKDKIFIYKKN